MTLSEGCWYKRGSSRVIVQSPGDGRRASSCHNERWGIPMNKAELIDAVAVDADISKASAARAVDSLVAAITSSLKSGESVTLVGFGTFSVRERPARSGRNPRTGETIQIDASSMPVFKAGKALKDAVN